MVLATVVATAIILAAARIVAAAMVVAVVVVMTTVFVPSRSLPVLARGSIHVVQPRPRDKSRGGSGSGCALPSAGLRLTRHWRRRRFG